MQTAPSIQRLLDELERLPGVGPKSAQRMVYYILNCNIDDAARLTSAIDDVKKSVHFCSVCFSYSENELCEICSNDARDNSIICVVSQAPDISAIERSHSFDGVYHVLGGEISPLDGIGPDDLRITELLKRLSSSKIEEVLVATNPSIEGETTAAYLARAIAPLGIKVTRLASGIPVGGELEYIDEVTLGRAIESRREISDL